MRAWLAIALCVGSLGCDVALGLGDFYRRDGDGDGGAHAEGGEGGTAGDGGGDIGGTGGMLPSDCGACEIADGDGICQPKARGETDTSCGTGETCDGVGRCGMAWSPTSMADVSLDRITTAAGKIVIAGTYSDDTDFGNGQQLERPTDGDADYYVALFDDSLNCERVHAVPVSEARGEHLRGVGWLSTGEIIMGAAVAPNTIIDNGGDVTTSVDADWMLANIDAVGDVDLFLVDAVGDQFLEGMEVRDDDIVIAGHFTGTQQLSGCGAIMAAGADDIFVAIMYPWLDCFAANVWGTQGGVDRVSDVTVNAAGEIAIAGYFLSSTLDIGSSSLSSDIDGDAFVAKLDDQLSPIWAQTLGATGAVDIQDIALTLGGDVLVGGTYPAAIDSQEGCSLPFALSGAVGGDADGFVARLDGSGGCNAGAVALPLDGPSADLAVRVAPLPDGTMQVAGMLRGTLSIGGASYGVSDAFSLFETRLEQGLTASSPIVHHADAPFAVDLVADDNGYALFAGTYQQTIAWADGTAETSDSVSAFLAKNATN